MPVIQELMGVPTFGSQVGGALGQGLGQGISQGLNQSLESFHKDQQMKRNEKKFLDLGYPPDLARLAAGATIGGETQILKDVLEERKRGLQTHNQQEVSDESDFESILKSGDSGLTPNERIRRQSERYKTGLPLYQEASTKLRGLNRDKERLHILDTLNKSGKLPANFERINVDAEGNLRFPPGSKPEAERYVKTLNEFSSGAKDTFGTRITNFDLQQYMKRFPTLLNSQEGRRQISKQMGIVNDINSVYYKNLKKVFDRAGGVRKIDSDIAEGLAEKMSEDEISKLVKEFDNISGEIEENPQNKASLKDIFG